MNIELAVIFALAVLWGSAVPQHDSDGENARASAAASAAVDAAAKAQAAEAALLRAVEQQRQEKQCVADSTPVQGKTVEAIVVREGELREGPSVISRAIVSLALGEQVSIEEGSNTIVGEEAQWTRVETGRSVDCPPFKNKTGWIANGTAVRINDFKPVTQGRRGQLYAEAGDWAGTFHFARDGTYGDGTCQGKLYQYADVIVGRAEVEGEQYTDIFIVVEGNGVCWAFDRRYCLKH